MHLPAFNRPLPLLLLVVALFTFLIQSGELGTSDTTHRLQVAHSLWTSQPQVFPYEYPDFGLHGRDGKLFASYGIGQSLLMLPADLAGTAASHWSVWRNYVQSEADPTIRNIIVSISTNILINVLTALAAYQLVVLLGFSALESVAGTLGLLCATTHLHYAQNLTENNYILLLTITGFALQYQWLITGNKRSLFWGSTALGLNLLTRITTALDIAAAACFILFAALFTQNLARSVTGINQSAQRTIGPVHSAALALARTYLQAALPVYAFFLFLDRLYQFIRFGSWTNTYVAILAQEQRQLNPSLPPTFPFDGHWLHGGINSGLLGPLLSPDKAIFLFDPLFPLALLLAILLWKHLGPSAKAFFTASLLLVVAYIALYGRYGYWAGDLAWGDRFISSAVELAGLLAIPMLLRYRQLLIPPIPRLAILVTAFSFIVQLSSLAFWLPLESYQMKTLGPHEWVVFLRFENIAAFLLGRQHAWGLDTPAIYQDPWDAAHLTTWNFLPALLNHIGAAPASVVHVLYAVWLIAALLLIAASLRLFRTLSRIENEAIRPVSAASATH